MNYEVQILSMYFGKRKVGLGCERYNQGYLGVFIMGMEWGWSSINGVSQGDNEAYIGVYYRDVKFSSLWSMLYM